MTVYVDTMEAPYGRMIMCHMTADTRSELLAMATAIGVSHRWLQKKGTRYEHFDISKGKKLLAIKNGAVLLTRRAFVMKLKDKDMERYTDAP